MTFPLEWSLFGGTCFFWGGNTFLPLYIHKWLVSFHVACLLFWVDSQVSLFVWEWAYTKPQKTARDASREYITWVSKSTLLETNSSHLKLDGWKTTAEIRRNYSMRCAIWRVRKKMINFGEPSSTIFLDPVCSKNTDSKTFPTFKMKKSESIDGLTTWILEHAGTIGCIVSNMLHENSNCKVSPNPALEAFTSNPQRTEIGHPKNVVVISTRHARAVKVRNAQGCEPSTEYGVIYTEYPK